MTPADIERLAREAGLPASISAHPGVKHLCRLVRAAALEEAVLAVADEQLADNTGEATDDAYNQALADATGAIRAIKGPSASSAPPATPLQADASER